jgi:hypothetical protein
MFLGLQVRCTAQLRQRRAHEPDQPQQAACRRDGHGRSNTDHFSQQPTNKRSERCHPDLSRYLDALTRSRWRSETDA